MRSLKQVPMKYHCSHFIILDLFKQDCLVCNVTVKMTCLPEVYYISMYFMIMGTSAERYKANKTYCIKQISTQVKKTVYSTT